MTPTELRALAEVVSADKTASRELANKVLLAFGWTRDADSLSGWMDPAGTVWRHGITGPNPLTSLDAANAGLPKGWRITDIHQRDLDGLFAVYIIHNSAGVRTLGTSEPHARTAAALLALAYDMENGNE